MTEPLLLETTHGPVVLRPEQPHDASFLYTLFRSHALADLELLPVDDATKENLVRMQFASQTATYRANYPEARFDIVQRDGVAIGRLVVDDNPEAACIVDLALLPDHRGSGLGTAIMLAMLIRLGAHDRPVRCKVLCNNTASLHMCRRAGFAQVGGELPFLQLEWHPPAIRDTHAAS